MSQQDKPDKIDLRVRRTHRLLQDALIELTAEKGFDNLTVADITERAMVNRTTFYRHYEDKYDLVARIVEEQVEKFSIVLGPPRMPPSNWDLQSAPDHWTVFFEHIAANARLYRSLLGRHGSSWFAARLRDLISSNLVLREDLREQVMADMQQPPQPRIPKEVRAALLAGLLVGALSWWLEDGAAYSPPEMARWFLRFAVRGYYHSIGLDHGPA